MLLYIILIEDLHVELLPLMLEKHLTRANIDKVTKIKSSHLNSITHLFISINV
jgi:hypothetical protein